MSGSGVAAYTTLLKLDYDGHIPARLMQRIRFVCYAHNLPVVLIETHRTVHGYHVIVHVARRVAFARVIMLQALLGSDWKRETFNSRRALAWRNVPVFWRTRANVLYHRHHRSV